jgi:spore coat protein H
MSRFSAKGPLLFVVLLSLFSFLFTCEGVAADANARPSEKRTSERFFARDQIGRVRIEVRDQDLASLRRAPREYVRAILKDGQEVYTDVAIKLKGGTGSFRSLDDKPSFTVNFDKFKKGQKFHGLDKCHLNNSVQDPTYMCEALGSQLCLWAGVPTLRTTHALVELNGRRLGLYVFKEGFDKTFLKRHFKNPHGNLYDGGFHSDVNAPLEKDSGDGPDNRSDLKALVRAAQEADLKKRFSALSQILDLDRFLTFMAMEVMIWHWDGYTMHHNNYRLYFDPTSAKFVFLAHGMDQLFFTPDGPVLPHQEGLVAKAVLEIPEASERYLERFKSLFESFYDATKLSHRIEELDGRLRPVLLEISPREVSRYDEAVQVLKRKVSERAGSLRKQIPPFLSP